MPQQTLTPERQQEWAINEIVAAWKEQGDDAVPTMSGRMAQAIAHLVVSRETQSAVRPGTNGIPL